MRKNAYTSNSNRYTVSIVASLLRRFLPYQCFYTTGTVYKNSECNECYLWWTEYVYMYMYCVCVCVLARYHILARHMTCIRNTSTSNLKSARKQTDTEMRRIKI